ncbi:MAG: hypothetical protein QGI18_04370 [Candidatus Marinimicrobia bacterium]|jgi:hypothetical protein|nr:hypothetical protein [Candidatus Neomarinimicrobiota bacterium]|tara:strand:+ start:1454 stop:1714 length:261 start_codon:yes stop_codon:yes gene_type:complete
MSPEEKKELDEWVEKEYPISMVRLKDSSPFHQIGKYLILIGIVIYSIYLFFNIYFLFPTSMLFLVVGIMMEIIALMKYYKSLSNEN